MKCMQPKHEKYPVKYSGKLVTILLMLVKSAHAACCLWKCSTIIHAQQLTKKIKPVIFTSFLN